jgi:hypothetical protein
MAKDIASEIERLSEERRALWADPATATNKAEVESLSAKIDALYEEKRMAAASHGTPALRKKAIKRALRERELDRLMGVA